MKNAKITLPIVGVFALSLVFLVAASCSNGTNTNVNSNTAVANVNEEVVENINEEPVVNENLNLNENVNTPVPTGSETNSINATWNSYTNYDLGFSINFPKQMYGMYTGCEWKADESSYRPLTGTGNVAIFEDDVNDIVYIANELFYELTGETVEGGLHKYSGCEEVNTALTHLRDDENYYMRDWEIRVADASGETDIEAFIQDEYGTDCTLDSLADSEYQAGIKNVTIFNTGPEGGCWINGMYAFYYYPAGEKLIHWGIGQDITFSDEDYTNYDAEMVESFRFL